MATTKLMTSEVLLVMPADGRLCELIEGVLVEVTPAGIDANGSAVRIAARLFAFVEERNLGLVVGADSDF